jgi:hypothetical protein
MRLSDFILYFTNSQPRAFVRLFTTHNSLKFFFFHFFVFTLDLRKVLDLWDAVDRKPRAIETSLKSEIILVT